jgi:hypothetical protein
MNHTGNEAAGVGPTFARIRLMVILTAATAAVFCVWLLVIRDNGSSSGSKPVVASADDVRALPSSVGHVVYWAGPRPSVTYELTHTSRGYVYIRYLPPGVKVGDKRPNFLTVGTYPKPNAFASVEKAANRKGEIVRKIGNGGLAVTSPKGPQSVYFAYPGSDVLVEVYDPSPAKALHSIISGQVTPVR